MEKQISMSMDLPRALDLEATLFCGQTFLWRRAGEGYLGCVDGSAAYIDQRHTLVWNGPATAADWENYFDFGRDYAAIAGRYRQDPHVSAAFRLYNGIRVLNQPVWETLCAFVISANNNIGRIGGIMARLCERYGEIRSVAGQEVHAFPQPQALLRAGEEGLRLCGLGYRAPYLVQCSRRVCEGFDFAALPAMGYDAALKALLTLPGIGEKVADCILLFSCGYSNAFPVDVWVRRIMRELYGARDAKAAIKAEGLRLFGEDAGIVQQALFYAVRTGGLAFAQETGA